MSKNTKFCPRCGEMLKKNTAVCPNCGTQIVHEKGNDEKELDALAKLRRQRVEQNVRLVENMSAAKREQLEKEAEKHAREAEILSQADDDEQDLQMSKSKAKKLQRDKKLASKKKQKKQRVHKKPELFATTANEDGTVSIDVRDVSFLPKNEIGVKHKKHKIPEKLKWYDIAKWADRMLARRKIKRVVKKASTEIPPEVSKGTMVTLCLLFGYFGAHSFYARNWVRGGVIMGSFIISVVVLSIDVLRTAVGVSLGGGFGFVFVFCWILDLIRIIFNKYRYRVSKNKFIATLDFETRAILGRKYIKKEIEENELYEQQRS